MVLLVTPTPIQLTFSARRQNTNDGDDQFRIWASSSETWKLAQAIPELRTCLLADQNWTRKVAIRWENGASRRMVLAAYAGQAGELSFTASKATLLFDYAAAVAARKTLFHGEYIFSANGLKDTIKLALWL